MSKRVIVIYKSVTGYTKQYANWIAEAISCDVKEIGDVNKEMLQKYDVIVYGGGLYAGGVSGMNKFKKLYPEIREKELILFTCGVADTQIQENVKHIEEEIAKVIPGEMYASMKQFHLRGGIDYSRLSLIHRLMMWMLCRMVKKKGYENLSGDDKMIVDTYGKKVDFSDQKTILPIVDYVSGNL